MRRTGSTAAGRRPSSRPGLRIRDAAVRAFAERQEAVLTVSELAIAAGVARGTVYNNIPEPDRLLKQVAEDLAREMIGRIAATLADVSDPVARLGLGVRMFLRRSHAEPLWGTFLVRYALREASLGALLHEPPAADVRAAVRGRRYSLVASQVPAYLSMIAGTVLSAMGEVVEGRRGWRDAGTDATVLLLRAAGVGEAEASRIALLPLPSLREPTS